MLVLSRFSRFRPRLESSEVVTLATSRWPENAGSDAYYLMLARPVQYVEIQFIERARKCPHRRSVRLYLVDPEHLCQPA